MKRITKQDIQIIEKFNPSYTIIRYYLGRHKIKVLCVFGKKAFIEHLENGYVGNKDIGYKQVKKGMTDITLTRFCRKIKR